MRKLSRILAVVLLLSLFMGSAVLPAKAVDQEYNFIATVGETTYLIIMSDAYDEITSAKIYNGVIPGLELDVAGGATLGLVGVPTTDGEFSVFITLTTQKLGTLDIRVNVNVNPAAPTGLPVVTKDPTGETVVEGESATFIARADNVVSYVWEIAIADASIDCKDLPSYLGKGVKVSGYNTDTLVISNIPKELDGAYVWCQFVNGDGSVTSMAAKLTVIAEEDATPVVTKHPTDETVEEGGEAVFVAKAKYAQEYLWRFVSPEGITYDCADAPDTFKGLQVSGADTERIVLKNIPAELDGYRIYCRFTAGDVVSSNMAKLYVTEKPTEPPTEEPTEVPAEEPTEVPTEEPTETPTEEPTEATKANSGKNTANKDMSGKANKNQKNTDSQGNNTALIIVAIIAATVVALAGIAAFVILKLKGKN